MPEVANCPEIEDAGEIVVWLDPLDGTAEFIDGLLSHVTTLIGIAYKGKALAGVINQPFYKNADGSIVKSVASFIFCMQACFFDD